MNMNKKILIILLGILILGFGLRVLYLPQNALTFGYDQARDAFVAQQIIAGDLKILGPPSSTPGLYHGVLYYYFLAIPYAISQNPIIAAYFLSFFNALGVFVIYYLGLLLTKKQNVGLLAAFFYAISFEATQYAAWLSNPTLAYVTVPLFYLGLWAWLSEKKRWGPAVSALGLGLSVQAEVFLLYHAVPLLIWIYLVRKQIKIRQIFEFGGILVLSTATMILSEIKFGFRGVTGLLSLLSSEEALSHAKSLGDYLVLFLNQVGRVYAFTTFPSNIGYGATLVFVLIILSITIWNRKAQVQKRLLSWEIFLTVWLLSHLSVVSVGGTSTPFLLVGIGPAVSIILAIWVSRFWKDSRLLTTLLLFVIVSGNIKMIISENKNGQTIFAIQKDMLLSKQIKTIDYTYKSADGEDFSINTITSPLWVNSVWSYLYNWYGENKYGYLPAWHGRDQVGRLGNNLDNGKDMQIKYLISEPLQGIPPRFIKETLTTEDDLYGLPVEEKRFGEIIVQKRLEQDE